MGLASHRFAPQSPPTIAQRTTGAVQSAVRTVLHLRDVIALGMHNLNVQRKLS